MKIPTFKNKDLYKNALIHRSYLNESKEKLESNERLEFLGDSILSFVVSQFLYKKYPNFDEGKLTNLRSLLVNTRNLAQVSDEIGLGKHLYLSKGEEESGGRKNQSLLADALEALIGALFLDQGLSAVNAFIEEVVLPREEEFIANDLLKDPKSLLQEKVQAYKKSSPIYDVVKEEGPAHAKTFTIGVFVNKELIGEGQGRSKQIAEENAAIKALEKLSGK